MIDPASISQLKTKNIRVLLLYQFKKPAKIQLRTLLLHMKTLISLSLPRQILHKMEIDFPEPWLVPLRINPTKQEICQEECKPLTVGRQEAPTAEVNWKT